MRASEAHTRSRVALVLAVLLATVTVFDIHLHVVIDQVELIAASVFS